MPRIFRGVTRPGRSGPSGERVVRQGSGQYTSRWRRFARTYRADNPFCAICRESGRLTFAALVDHKYPVADGGPMFPGPEGVWSLCVSHHAWKAQLENYARRTGQVDQIVVWCDEPHARPVIRGQT